MPPGEANSLIQVTPAMPLVAAVLRRIVRFGQRGMSRIRILMLRLLYPAFSADRRTFIGPDCDIAASNDSAIRLRGAWLGRGVNLHADNGGVIEIIDASVGRYSVIAAKEAI